MKYRTRTYYTDSQKALMWERWKAGWTLHQIAKLFDRAAGSVRGILAQTGGIRPPERHRSRLALTLAEREEIRVLSRRVSQSVQLPRSSGERRPRSVVRSNATAIKKDIERLMPTARLGSERIGRRFASWLRTEPWRVS